jgi:hypothetical protein
MLKLKSKTFSKKKPFPKKWLLEKDDFLFRKQQFSVFRQGPNFVIHQEL